MRKLIYSQRHVAFYEIQNRGVRAVDLRDLKTFLHLAESRHFSRSARAMHVSPSTLSRQIQRLEEDLGQPLFVRDNRTVTLPKPGKSYVPLPNRLYCSISSFVTSSISRALRSPASCTSSALSPPPIAICRRSSTAFAPRTPRWRSSSRPATPPTLWRRSSPAKPTAIAGKPETLRGRWRFRCWRTSPWC